MTVRENSLEVHDFSDFVEISSQKGALTAVSKAGKRVGIKDIIDPKTAKRFLLFPFDAEKSYQIFKKPENNLYIPEKFGRVRTGKQIYFAYQVPADTISLETLDLKDSNQHQFSLNVLLAIKLIQEKYGLPEEIFKNYQDYWSIDVKNLKLIFIPKRKT